jgi:hypothetical protein
MLCRESADFFQVLCCPKNSPEIMALLKVEPELGRGVERFGEAKRQFRRHGTSLIDDLGDRFPRNTNGASQLNCRDLQRLKVKPLENASGMIRCSMSGHIVGYRAKIA